MSPEMITAIGALVLGVSGIVSAILLHLKTIALITYRLEQVEKRLDSHNHYAEKFSQSAAQIAEIQTDIAVIKTTLEYIKEK